MKLSSVKLPSYGGPSNTQKYRADAGWSIEFFPRTHVIAITKGDATTLVSCVGAEMIPADSTESLLALMEAEDVQPSTTRASAPSKVRRTEG